MCEDPNVGRGVALALAHFHSGMEKLHGQLARDLLAVGATDDTVVEIEVPIAKGQVQKRILRLANIATERGLSAREVADELDGYDEANAHAALKSLVSAKYLEVVDGSSPRRWRLTLQHRRNRILRMSRLIPKGKWATYGDVAIAVYGSRNMAVTIGQVARHSPAFVNPHRVLKAGGVIADEWEDDEGNGPDECARRLREDGIDIDPKTMTADLDKRIRDEELAALLTADEDKDGFGAS